MFLPSNTSFGKITTGFFFHLLGSAVVATTGNQIFQAIICTIGWYYIIKGFSQIKNLHVPFQGGYRVLFILYLLLCAIMILRGYLIDYNYQWISFRGLINFHFYSPTYILPYLMPLLAFIPLKYYDFRPFIKVSVIVACLSIILMAIFLPNISKTALSIAMGDGGDYGYGSSIADVYIPVAFAVLCRRYIPNRIWLVNSIALFLCLITFAIAARRGGTVITACLFLFNIYYYIKSKNKNIRIVVILMSIIFILGLVYYSLSSDYFAFIRERGMEDTRSGVDRALLDQMSDAEMIFGKGLNGRYYYPLSEDDYLNGWRYGSETGFMNIVLKGGFLVAIVYVLLLLLPALKGIFQSRNTLCKALGCYIILSLVELYPFGWLMFNMKFMIIWMGVALCYSPIVRRLSDKDIYNLFFSPK